MPFNSVLVVSAAEISAEVWQHLACLPERIAGEQLVDLVLCFPLQQLGRWALWVWNCLCFHPHADLDDSTSDSDYYYSDDDSDRGGGGGGAASSSFNSQSGYRYSRIQNPPTSRQIILL